jgi:hypothetical protein
LKILLVIHLLLLFIFPTLSSAAMIGLTTQELTDSAEVIVVGVVMETKPEWNADQSLILTRITVRIEETIKGNVGNMLELEHIGGEIGNIGLRTSNQPSFSDGENVILFLRTVKNGKKSDGLFELVGMSQGKYTLRQDGTAEKSTAGIITGIIDGVETEVDADDFLQRIREMCND